MRQMNTVERFKKFSKKTYNAQDVLKNHILQRFPILYVEDAKNYDLKQLDKFKDKSDYVWVVDKDIEVYRSFPWHYKPKRDDYGCTICFPYVFKESKRVSSWEKVRLVPTTINDETQLVTETNICGDYDVYRGKHNFDIFFLGDKETGTWEDLRKRFPEAIAVKTYQDAMRLAVTDMFWIVYDDLIIDNTFEFDYEPDEWSFKYPHLFGNGKNDKFDGIALMPKSYIPTDKELEYRFLAQKKQVKQVASKPRNYEIFSFDTYEDYEVALKTSKTELFWHVPKDVIVEKDFDFSINFDFYNMFDRDITHVFKNKDSYDGIVLFSKKSPVTRKEFEHRFYIEKKEWDVVASHPKPYDVFNVENYNDYLNALDKTTTELVWVSTNNISVDHDYINNFYIDWHNRVDREQTHIFLHKANNELYKNGLMLCSKHKVLTEKEIKYRHPVERKEWNDIVSTPVVYNKFNVENYNDYLNAFDNSKTEMFWISTKNIDTTVFDFSSIYFTHDNEYDRTINHTFIHKVNDDVYYNGLILCSKHSPLTENEVNYRYPINRKEWNVVASVSVKYPVYNIDNYNDYLNALNADGPEMFWMSSNNISPTIPDLYFLHENEYDRKTHHSFIHQAAGKTYRNGLFLISKHKTVTEKEIEHRFIVNAKEWDIVASSPVVYDKFYIETFDDYINALDNTKTEMFWALSHNIKINETELDKIYFTHDNEYDRKQNHAFAHKDTDEIKFNGVFLLSKHKPITEKEIEHRFIVNAKEWNTVVSTNGQYEKFTVNNYNDYLNALENSKTELFWGVPLDVIVLSDFKFDMNFNHSNEYDRKINHVMFNGDYRDGVVLFSKHAVATQKEVDTRFYVNKKDHNIVASYPKPYDFFFIDTYDQYLDALEKSTTDMFWMGTHNIKISDTFNLNMYFSHHETFDRNINHVFKHKCGDEISFDGLFLCTKKIVLTEKEVEHRLVAKRKEWDIVASGPVVYDKFIIKNYADYLNAVQNSKTEMFWSIPDDVDIANNFKFDLYFPHNQWFERSIHHIFKNGSAYDGVALMSKKLPAIEHEVTHRFYLEKKEYDIVASNPKTYDIVFISKDEERADTNYSKLKERFPNAKRVHGVQGIHQAHIEAARLCSSEMIWVVDADAEIIDNFNFDYYIPTYDPDSKKTVHVWKSLNPINNLVYGYGAVKLLPKELTLNMDTTKPDMTTSISTLFKSINRVSNITKFNTDPFSTWRSAFRECVKLSSKTIDGQRDEETDFRLNVWCTRGKDKEFGDYCIAGANAGKQYGIDNIGNIEALRKINDFDWLKEQFTKLNQQS